MGRWLFLIFLGAVGAFAVRGFMFEGVFVATPSMEPTLPVGNHYFVNKLSPFFRGYNRKEIVVFHSPIDRKKDLIKRVIGLPGETIKIENKKVFINDQPIAETYTEYKRKDEILVGDNISSLKIPEDCYFVMGDNRDESGDSRDWKDKNGINIYFICQDQIRGILMNTLE